MSFLYFKIFAYIVLRTDKQIETVHINLMTHIQSSLLVTFKAAVPAYWRLMVSPLLAHITW